MHLHRADKDHETTERIMRALDAAQPAAGFEERVLQRLAQHASSEQPVQRFGLARLGMLAGAGCAAAVLVVLLSLHVGSKRRAVPLHTGMTALAPSPQIAADQPLVAELTTRQVKAPHTTHPVPVMHVRRDVVPPPELAHDDDTKSVPLAADLDRQALDDLHAANTPPPPLPSTAQERMVKLMLRRGEKHDLAQLDPAQSIRITDAERHSFQTFFDPDPSPELALELKKGNLR